MTEKTKFCLQNIENIISQRLQEIQNNPADPKANTSYVRKLNQAGINRIAQKVGEEASETIIAALVQNKQELIEETSDLLFHLLILLNIKKVKIKDVYQELEKRHQQMSEKI